MIASRVPLQASVGIQSDLFNCMRDQPQLSFPPHFLAVVLLRTPGSEELQLPLADKLSSSAVMFSWEIFPTRLRTAEHLTTYSRCPLIESGAVRFRGQFGTASLPIPPESRPSRGSWDKWVNCFFFYL